MNAMVFRTALAVAAMLVFAGGAEAQPRRNYNVQIMNFDLWCQETMSLPYARCIRRLPADVEQFEAFRTQIEGQEIPHLQQKNRESRIETDILHNDPVDRPSATAQPGGLIQPRPAP